MRDKKWFGRIIAVVMTLIMSMFCTAGCGSEPVKGSPEEEEIPEEEIIEEEAEETPVILEGWDYFESVSCIGRSYEELSSEYDLIEGGAIDGGVFFSVDGDQISLGFPALSMEDMSGDVECTAMYGTLGTLFGIRENIAIDDLNKLLDAHCEADQSGEGAYYGISDYQNCRYNIVLYSESVGAELGPDTGVRVGINN